ncbi:MAG: xanthine dehydrogenase family protein molybdopterin-binding subunit [Actinomycetota bacterium]|nr:xanthine dehydrogenase family protein molybdopterin-binding subunit [Actinomycetota bacterium]
MVGSLLGNAVRRVEDPDLVTGRSTFVDDLRIAGTAHAVFVRSSFAHARIAAIDTAEAERSPGVLAVHTSETLGSKPVPPFAEVNAACVHAALAVDAVRYVGDPVALVVAETRAQAVDAAELVDVDYEELPVVADMEAALADDAPLQFPELGSNVAASTRSGAPTGDDADVLSGAAVTVRARIENQRVATAPIEGNAILVEPTHPDGPGVTVHVATQQPHMARDLVARYTGLDKSAVRVVVPHVGGAFGGKAGISYGHAAIVAASRALGRPVAWTETRSEAMLSMQGRGQVQFAELGLSDDGTIVGLRARVIGDCGAYAGFGGVLALGPTQMMAQGPYEIPRLEYSAIAALTNTAPNGAFRGAGRPEATAMLERMLDLAADEIGLSPEEIRRRNLIPRDAFPYKTRTGMTYDVGDYQLALEKALRIADVTAARAEQQRRRESCDVRQLGIGISTYVEITGFGGSELGSVVIEPDGSATVMSGTSAHGQGHATSFAMIVSDRLGIPMDQIRYVQSDTYVVRTGGGTGGSRSLQLGGSAVSAAARDVHEQAVALAARLLEADASDIEVVLDQDGGGLGVQGVPGARLSWSELAARADEQGTTLRADLDVPQHGATFPFGAHVAIVEVDTETGHATPLRHVAVDDCGRILNPMIVAGQQHGGVVQGMSQALWEQFVYDAEGQPLTSTFADYTMPTAADTISLEVSNTETPTTLNELGAKGIGESGTIGSTPAVQNAVIDAVSHLGVRHIDLPCTPLRVWTAIRDARAGTGAVPWHEPPVAFDRIPTGTGDAEGGVEI